MEFEGNTTVIGDKKVFYWQKNPEGKEVIVLLHGFPGNYMGLIDLANSLNHDYRVIIPDLPGCGLSETLTGQHTLENYAIWLNNFLEQVSAKHTIIIGHSFGSRVALFFSFSYPEKIKKLVLMTPVLKIDGLIAYFIALHCNVAKLLPKYLSKVWLSNGFYQKVSHAIIFKSSNPKKRQQIMEQDFKESKNIDHRVAMEIFDEFYHSNLIHMASSSTSDFLIIAGDSDEIVSVNSIEELSANLINSKIEIMENAGHLVPLEEPQKVADLINNYI